MKVRSGGKFAAVIFKDGKQAQKNFGSFEAAHACWQHSKAQHLIFVAKETGVPEEVLVAVLNRANTLLSDCELGMPTGEYL